MKPKTLDLNEILDKLYRQGDFEGEHKEIHPDRIAEAKDAIKSHLRAKMPKKREINHGEGHPYTQHDRGFNKAIEAVERIIDTL